MQADLHVDHYGDVNVYQSAFDHTLQSTSPLFLHRSIATSTCQDRQTGLPNQQAGLAPDEVTLNASVAEHNKAVRTDEIELAQLEQTSGLAPFLCLFVRLRDLALQFCEVIIYDFASYYGFAQPRSFPPSSVAGHYEQSDQIRARLRVC